MGLIVKTYLLPEALYVLLNRLQQYFFVVYGFNVRREGNPQSREYRSLPGATEYIGATVQ